MTNFLFQTETKVKVYDLGKWAINDNLVKDIMIKAKDINEAYEKYAEIINKRTPISISKTAVQNKVYFCVDSRGAQKNKGYVITGRIILKDAKGREVKKYIDLYIRTKEMRA